MTFFQNPQPRNMFIWQTVSAIILCYAIISCTAISHCPAAEQNIQSSSTTSEKDLHIRPVISPIFGKFYRPGSWFPLQANVPVGNLPVKSTIELRDMTNNQPLFTLQAELNQNTNNLPAILPGGGVKLSIHYTTVSGQSGTYEYPQPLLPLASNRGSRIRVCCPAITQKNNLTQSAAFDGQCTAQSLPQDSWFYHGVDLLYLDKLTPQNLSTRQLTAISDWLTEGGVAVVHASDYIAANLVFASHTSPGHSRPLLRDIPEAASVIPCGNGWVIIVNTQAANLGSTGMAINKFLDSRRKVKTRYMPADGKNYYRQLGDWPQAPKISLRKTILLCTGWFLLSLGAMFLRKTYHIPALVAVTLVMSFIALETAPPQEKIHTIHIEDNRHGHNPTMLQLTVARSFSAQGITIPASGFPPPQPLYNSISEALGSNLNLSMRESDYVLRLTPHKTPQPPKPGYPQIFFRSWPLEPVISTTPPDVLYGGIIATGRDTHTFTRAEYNQATHLWKATVHSDLAIDPKDIKPDPLLAAWMEYSRPPEPYALICGYRSANTKVNEKTFYCTVYLSEQK